MHYDAISNRILNNYTHELLLN